MPHFGEYLRRVSSQAFSYIEQELGRLCLILGSTYGEFRVKLSSKFVSSSTSTLMMKTLTLLVLNNT